MLIDVLLLLSRYFQRRYIVLSYFFKRRDRVLFNISNDDVTAVRGG